MMPEGVENLRCPFCGKRDIEYELALCAGCQADIQYDKQERNSPDLAMGRRLEAMQAKVERATAAIDTTPFLFRGMAIKKAKSLIDEFEKALHEAINDSNARVNRRLVRGDTTSIATFQRGGREIDVSVFVPGNQSAKVDFDVELVAVGPKKIMVVQAVRALTGLGLIAAKDLVESVPATLLKGCPEEAAIKAREGLRAVGATVELR